MDYVGKHAAGETTILFLRKAAVPDETYVTMEVKNRHIKQVYGCCNSLPGEAVYKFLAEKYTKDKCIVMDGLSALEE